VPEAQRGAAFIWIVALAIAVGQLGTNLYLPALPSMATEFGASTALMAQTLTVYLAGCSLATLVVGPLSDTYGRRPVVLGGLVVYIAGTVLCALAGSIASLMVGRLVQSLGASCAPVAGRAMIKDATPDHLAASMLGLLGMVMAIAPALAPIIGGLVTQTMGWRWVFWTLLIICLAVLWFCLRALPETLGAERRIAFQPLAILQSFTMLAKDRIFTWNLATLAAAFMGMGVLSAGAPFLFIRVYHFSPLAYGATNLANVGGFVLGNALGTRVLRNKPMGWIYAAGAAPALASGGLMFTALNATTPHPSLVVLAIMLFATGIGALFPLTTKIALGRGKSLAGAASALIGFGQIASCGAGSFLFAALVAAHADIGRAIGLLNLGYSLLIALCAWPALLSKPQKEKGISG